MSEASTRDEKLARMANQIAQNLMMQSHDDAVASVVDHLRAFWTPKMRSQLIDLATRGGADLEPLAREAVQRLASV